MTDGHADFHTGPLHVVEVQVVEDGQGHGGQGDASGAAVGLLSGGLVTGVVALKVLDDLPEEQRLDDLDGLLMSRDSHSATIRWTFSVEIKSSYSRNKFLADLDEHVCSDK